jgi:predicted nucleotidyltransferase
MRIMGCDGGPIPVVWTGDRRSAVASGRRGAGASLREVVRHREEILAVAARHGASNVRVFGSVARGEADDRSDIDFLVDLEHGRSLFDLAGLLVDLEDLLDRPVDVATVPGLKTRIRDRVLAEAVAL